ncbi:MAG: translation elongation factor Ts [Phycisphaeraceae bacterium]
MAITAKDVMDLRNKTGLGMMECKAALAETGGDVQKAIDLLRQKGIAKMDSRADRASAAGQILTAVTPDKKKGAVVEINTETDFTAGNESFKKMMGVVVAEALKQAPGDVEPNEVIKHAIDEVRITTKENVRYTRGQVIGGGPHTVVGHYTHFNGSVGVLVELEVADGAQVADELLADLGMHVTAIHPRPIAVDEHGVPADVIAREKQIAKAQAIEQGKPEQIAEKMVVGKIRKFYEDHCLTEQCFIKDEKKRIKEILPKGVKIKSFVRYQVGLK